MTPNDKIILAAFIRALVRLDKKLPITVQNDLAMIQDVAQHTRRLDLVVQNYTDLAILYEEEFDRLCVDASDRTKGYLPSFDSDDYDQELSNLAEIICHSANPTQTAKDVFNVSGYSRIQDFFNQLLIQNK